MDDVMLHRWADVLEHLAELLPDGPAYVVVDGPAGPAATVANRLRDTLLACGRPAGRLSDANPFGDEDDWYREHTATSVAVADGPRWRAYPPAGRWDLVIWLRSVAGLRPTEAAVGGSDPASGEFGADVVLDVGDPAGPAIRHVGARLREHAGARLRESEHAGGRVGGRAREVGAG